MRPVVEAGETSSLPVGCCLLRGPVLPNESGDPPVHDALWDFVEVGGVEWDC